MSSRVMTSADGMSALKRFTEVRKWDMYMYCSDTLTDKM